MNTAFTQALSAAIGHCIATHAVREDGAAVGFMYRETAQFAEDSGWRFFSGDESDEYTAHRQFQRLYRGRHQPPHTRHHPIAGSGARHCLGTRRQRRLGERDRLATARLNPN